MHEDTTKQTNQSVFPVRVETGGDGEDGELAVGLSEFADPDTITDILTGSNWYP